MSNTTRKPQNAPTLRKIQKRDSSAKLKARLHKAPRAAKSKIAPGGILSAPPHARAMQQQDAKISIARPGGEA